MTNDFVTDLTLRKSPRLTDLRDLLLTLPVFEVSPSERKAFVYNHCTLIKNEIYLEGNGAQPSLRLKRLSEPSYYELIVESLESEELQRIYKMKRSDSGSYGYDGWEIISRKNKHRIF